MPCPPRGWLPLEDLRPGGSVFTRVKDMMQAKIDALCAGDLVEAVSFCDFPMTVWLGERELRFVRPSDMICFLQDVQQLRHSAGITSSEAEILSIEIPRRGLFRVWVRWLHKDAAGALLDHADMIYHCRESRKRLRVEAAEVLKFSLPGVAGIPVPRRQII